MFDIGPERIDEMAHHIAVNEGLENAYVPLTEEDIKKILTDSLICVRAFNEQPRQS